VKDMQTPAANRRLMIVVRYVIPGAIVLAGTLALILNRSLTGLEGLAMGIGVGASVLLLNVLYRVGVAGDAERDLEADARDYFDEHGHWPDEAPPPTAPPRPPADRPRSVQHRGAAHR
jgi:hypothetical protein